MAIFWSESYATHSHKVLIELLIHVFIMKHGHRVGASGKVGEHNLPAQLLGQAAYREVHALNEITAPWADEEQDGSEKRAIGLGFSLGDNHGFRSKWHRDLNVLLRSPLQGIAEHLHPDHHPARKRHPSESCTVGSAAVDESSQKFWPLRSADS